MAEPWNRAKFMAERKAREAAELARLAAIPRRSQEDLLGECERRLTAAKEALSARRAEMKAAHCARQKGRGGFIRGLWIEEMGADEVCSRLSREERIVLEAQSAAQDGRLVRAADLLQRTE